MAYKYSYDEDTKYVAPKKRTDRNVLKLIIFSLLTCGLYSIFFYTPFSVDLDDIAPKRDGTKTFNYFLALILSYFTWSIVMLCWLYSVTARIEEALSQYKIDYEFGTQDFWMWHVLGSLILVGPLVFTYKLCKAMNLLCAAYNEKNEAK